MVVVVAIKRDYAYINLISLKTSTMSRFFCVLNRLLEVCLRSSLQWIIALTALDLDCLSSSDGVHTAANCTFLFVVVAPSFQEGDISTSVVDGGFKQLLQPFFYEDRLQQS